MALTSGQRAASSVGRGIPGFITALQKRFGQRHHKGAKVQVERRKLRTITSLCGQKKASAHFLRRLDDDLRAAGIHSEPPIVSPFLRPGDWVRFSRSPFPPTPIFFPKEKDLQSFVEACIGNGPFRDLEPVPRLKSGSEFRLPSRERIDFLCQERTKSGTGALVAIEFKRTSKRGTFMQMVGYLNQLQELNAFRPVRGIVISGSEDRLAASVLKNFRDHNIDWYRYSVTFERISGSSKT